MWLEALYSMVWLGLLFLAPGFFEYEHTADGHFLVTLLRAVGQLSREDVATRPGHAGWPVPTPLAQCLGPDRMQLALCPVTTAWQSGAAGLAEIWEDVFLPPRAVWLRQSINLDVPELDIWLQGDLVRLSQVLSNLINNASKFSGPGTSISLAAAYGDGEVRIQVKDQGSGIDPGFLPHIFELFAQGDQSLDRSQGGLGIGLTLVKHLVELHGGRVWAFSAGAGLGTEVTVALPAHVAEQGDGAAIEHERSLTIEALEPAEALLFDLPPSTSG